MSQAARKLLYSLLLPLALIVAAACGAWQWEALRGILTASSRLNAMLVILPYLPFLVCAACAILGWRFDNTGLVLTAAAIALAYVAAMKNCPALTRGNDSGLCAPRAAAFLLPLNVLFFSTLTRRRLFTSVGMLASGLLALEAVFVAFSRNPVHGRLVLLAQAKVPWIAEWTLHAGEALSRLYSLFPALALPTISAPALALFAWTLPFFLVRFFLSRDVLYAGFLFSTLSVALGMAVPGAGPKMLFFLAAGMVLLVASAEAHFSMAYLDELTGLPGRRSLNVALLNLGRKYSVAMIDVDHFKRLNDRYGHKTGDQALKMIAARLMEMTGNAQVYRYGGEEFTALFPGKGIDEARPHLDLFREKISSRPFVIRSRLRERSSPDDRGKVTLSGRKRIRITVSVGVADPRKRPGRPQDILKAADKALFAAKKAGRNRVVS